MPQLNDKVKIGHNWKIWHACIDCGKERWVQLQKGQPSSLHCLSCAGKGVHDQPNRIEPTERAEGEPPQVGDIQRGECLGHAPKTIYILRACVTCGKKEWAVCHNGKPSHPCCVYCAAKNKDRRARLSATILSKRLQTTERAPGEPPQVGDILYGKALGYRFDRPYIRHACESCGKQRWVPYINSPTSPKRPSLVLCKECSLKAAGLRRRLSGSQKGTRLGRLAPNWKNGKHTGKDGYVKVLLTPDDFFYPMATKNHYVLEHRLVMAKKLGRLLQPWEIPHHRDLDHSNNNPDNLELKMKGHGYGTSTKVQVVVKLHEAKAENKQLETRIKQLEAENAALRKETPPNDVQ